MVFGFLIICPGQNIVKKLAKRHTQYSRMRLLSKLKYIGVQTEDLIDVYCRFIRSIVEYCSVVFHSGLTEEQNKQLENIQTMAMHILLQENFVSPSAAREMTGLRLLTERREDLVQAFSRKCLNHPKHKSLFPLNQKSSDMILRNHEKFQEMLFCVTFCL